MASITQLSQGRSTTHMMHPDSIVADHKHNGRYLELPEPTDLIKAFLAVGQLQAVSIRTNPDKELGPLLVYGFRRWLAAKIINDKGMTGAARPSADEPFLLECKILDAKDSSDYESFRRNIIENAAKEGVNPMDDAHNLHRLIKDYGLSKSEAAAIYNKPGSWVTRRLALLTLSPDIQAKIADGTISASAGEELAKAPEEVREDLGAKVVSGESLTQTEIASEVRADSLDPKKKAARKAAAKAKEEDSPDAEPVKRGRGRPKSAHKSRTAKEVKIMFKLLSEDESMGPLGMLLASWMDGKLTDNGLKRKMLPFIKVD